jgi:hypothetical protein
MMYMTTGTGSDISQEPGIISESHEFYKLTADL